MEALIIRDFIVYQDRVETNLAYCSFSRIHKMQYGLL